MKNDVDIMDVFRVYICLSSCTFGGGFVIVSLMKKKLFEELWR